MKKKFTIALMSLVMIPCLLLLTACKQTISTSDYQENVHKAAVKYYDNYGSNDMKLVHTETEESSCVQELSRTQGTETFKEKFTFTYEAETTQTIEFDNGKNLRVTTVEKTTETGTEVKDDNSGFETVTETSETTTIVTFVDDGTTQKVYKTVEVKEDGEVVEAEAVKQVYTYTSGEEYTQDINEMLYDIDENLVSNYFEAEVTLMFNLYGSSETYKDGREFGLKAGFVMGSTSNSKVGTDYEYGAEMIKYNLETTFKDGQPNTYKLVNSTESTGGDGVEDVKTSTVNELTYTYEATVTAPTGFVEEDAVGAPISLPIIENISFGMGL